MLTTPSEEDLTASLEAAMEKHPDTYAVLVRRHGMYVMLRMQPMVVPLTEPATSGEITCTRQRHNVKGAIVGNKKSHS